MGRVGTLRCMPWIGLVLIGLGGGCITSGTNAPCPKLNVAGVQFDEPVPQSLWEATDSVPREAEGEISRPSPQSLMDATVEKSSAKEGTQAKVTRGNHYSLRR